MLGPQILPAAAFTGARQVSAANATLHAGDRCPECLKGKVYRQKDPATLIRFVGHAPLEATVFEMERLRCNACQQVFTADEPETAGPEKYAVTVVAMIALLKYGTGVPFKRLERLQEQLGMPLAATTQWDLVAAAAQLMRPVLEALIRLAAQGSVMHNDDTSMRILRLTREPGDKRTGTFTSGIVSLVGAWTIALFFTGWKHAGENIADVLKQRAGELPAPIQMCGALSRNTPKGVETLIANCLAHDKTLNGATARGGVEAQPIGVDALELPSHPGAAHHTRRREVDRSCLAEKHCLRPGLDDLRKTRCGI